MTMQPNDPRLTAYALGEANATDTAAVEAALREQPELSKEIDAIRQLGNELASGLSAEQAPSLTDDDRRQVYDRPSKTVRFPKFNQKHRWMAAAAILMLLLGSISVLQDRSSVTSTADLPVEPEYAPQPPVQNKPETAPVVAAQVPQDASSREIVGLDEVQEVTTRQPEPSAAPRQAPVTERAETEALTLSNADFDQVNMARSPVMMKSLMGSRRQRSKASHIMPFAPPVVVEPPAGYVSPLDTEEYDMINENPFRRVVDHPLSTFSIDVDTASYANIRRMLNQGILPPADAVRIEEMINYFSYDYAEPDGEHPFAAHLAITESPWTDGHQLVRIGIKGKEIAQETRAPINLVFLLDVSGSMNQPNKLPLVKRALKMLVRNLDERDRVAIVVYAGASGLVLPPTACDDDQAILDALERLQAGGSTNGGAGIELAYATALEHFATNGINRVILCTDGDFNVGTVQTGDLVRMVEQKAKDGIFLSVLGFGMGNYKDATLEQLANKGNGNYAYIDTFNEARKVLVDQLTGTLITIAKDVKIQIEFNPACVAGYRLIGYENRMLNKEDFNDDTKDAGEIGAGHTVTALYELIPADHPIGDTPAVDDLRYQSVTKTEAQLADEIMTVKIRYKKPNGNTSTRLTFPLSGEPQAFQKVSDDFRFASAVAAFGMLLRDSEHKGTSSFDQILAIAESALGKDDFGYRREFMELVRNAKALKGE